MYAYAHMMYAYIHVCIYIIQYIIMYAYMYCTSMHMYNVEKYISCPWYKIDIFLYRIIRRPGHAHLHQAQFWNPLSTGKMDA